MKYAIVNSDNIIENLIDYDGVSNYSAPSSCTLQEVNPWLQIGQNISASEPSPPTPTAAQLAAIAIAGGIIVTSTATSALDGTYPIDPTTQQDVNNEIAYIGVTGAFSTGATLPWFDISGNAHNFTQISDFKNFAIALAGFISAIKVYVKSNGATGSIPSNEITIP